MARFSRPCLCAMLSLALLLSACGTTPVSSASVPAASADHTSTSKPGPSAGAPGDTSIVDPVEPEPDGGIAAPQGPDLPKTPDVSHQPGPDVSREEPAPGGSIPSDEKSSADSQLEGVQESSYDFSQPVPEREAVDKSYFADAAFIGDSRTDGFMLFSGIGCGENLTSNGLSIFRLAEKKALKIDGESYTLLEALELKEYGKVYLSLGVNELGVYNDKGFYRAYCDAIDAIRAAQPNAVIYIQGLIPLNEEVIAKTGGFSYLTNEHLLIYNDLMKQAAEEKQVAFLDLNPYFADEAGSLPADDSSDGVHLKTGPCKKWLEYLQTHTVDYDTLYPTVEEDLT